MQACCTTAADSRPPTPDDCHALDDQKGWISSITGHWAVQGRDKDGPGQDELLFLHVTLDGVITGAVDDGDGKISEDDCKIVNGRLDAVSREIEFDQIYGDGAVTHWRAHYNQHTDTLVRGVWTGACDGTFTGVRSTPAKKGIPGAL